MAGCGSGGGGGSDGDGSTTTDNTNTTTTTGNNTGTNGTGGGNTTTGDTGTGCDNSYNLSNLRNWKTDYSPEEIKNTIINTNSGLWYNWPANVLVRYRTPIKIYTGGIGYFDEAVNNIEIYTGGLISFQRVSSIDELQQGKGGIAVIHGYSETCGHVYADNNYTDQSSPCRGESLGTSYAVRDNRCSQTDDIGIAVTEHEIMHCLGMTGHFDGFQGAKGIKDNLYTNGTRDGSFGRAVLMNMYQNPHGTTRENLKISSY